MIYTVERFSVVNEAEVDVFLEFSCFFCDLADFDNVISCSSAFFKLNLYVWASPIAHMIKNLPAVQETWAQSLVGNIPWRREWQLTPVFLL